MPNVQNSSFFLPEIEGLAHEQPALYESLRKIADKLTAITTIFKAGELAPEGNIQGVPGSFYVQYSKVANGSIGVWVKTLTSDTNNWVQVIAVPAGVAGASSVKTSAGSLTTVNGEFPSGATDGVNTTFTLVHAPNPPTSLQLFVNSVRTYNFSLSGNTITMGAPPAPGDILSANYTY